MKQLLVLHIFKLSYFAPEMPEALACNMNDMASHPGQCFVIQGQAIIPTTGFLVASFV